jgi:hypothetical protein
MKIVKSLPKLINWNAVASEKVPGTTGYARVRTQKMGTVRVRLVKYSRRFFADHWCEKGHIVLVLKGMLVLEHKNRPACRIKKGMSYLIGDRSMAHRARSRNGATVYIVD